MALVKIPQRRMWRSGVSRTERAIGVFLLCLIAGIGAAIGIKGQHWDPDLFALNDALLGEAPSPFARVLPVAWEAPAWVPGQTVERYGPNSLYEKINGRADQYLSYDVQGLEVHGFTASTDSGRFIDIYLYDMRTPLNAFGIFSAERTPGAAAVDLGQAGYEAGGSIFFHAGRFYAQVIPGEGDPASLEAAAAIAKALGASLPAEDGDEPASDPAAALPQEGLDAESVQYVKQDVLGLEFLQNAVTANYDIGGEFLSVFLIREQNPTAAFDVLELYRAYINKYGTLVEVQTTPNGKRIVGDVSGFFDVVFTHGPWIGGVSGASAREPAEALAMQLADGVSAPETNAP